MYGKNKLTKILITSLEKEIIKYVSMADYVWITKRLLDIYLIRQ
jgi:hypothetical protein